MATRGRSDGYILRREVLAMGQEFTRTKRDRTTDAGALLYWYLWTRCSCALLWYLQGAKVERVSEVL